MKSIFTQGARLGVGHAAIDPALSSGTVAAAHSMVNINGDKPSTIDTAAAIEMISARVRDGDMSDLEAILVGQAVAMNVAGLDMISRARKVGTTDALNTLGAAGMRAIAHRRAAIDSLANLRNPRQVAFVKQANINNGGQQQVNNTNDIKLSRTPAHEASTPPELLLEANASQTLEPRATRRASRGDSQMEAVGAQHGSKHRRGARNVGA